MCDYVTFELDRSSSVFLNSFYSRLFQLAKTQAERQRFRKRQLSRETVTTEMAKSSLRKRQSPHQGCSAARPASGQLENLTGRRHGRGKRLDALGDLHHHASADPQLIEALSNGVRLAAELQ